MTMASQIAVRYKLAMRDIALQFALLAAAWFFFKLNIVLVCGVAVCILGGPLFPPRLAWLASLLGFGGLSALAYFYFGDERVAAVLGVAAIVMSAWAYFDKRSASASAQ